MGLYEYVGLWGRYSLKQGNPLYLFQNTNPIIFVTFISLFFDLLYQRGYQRQYFWTLNLKVLAYEAATAWNRGIPCNFSKHWSNCICFIYFYIFDLLNQRGYQSQYFWTLNLKVLAYEAATAWNRVIPFNFFQNTDLIVFVLFISLFLTYCIKEGIKGNIFGHKV